MSDIPSFPYACLYGERILRSVTNLTREDGKEFFELLQQFKIETIINPYPLEKANEALVALKAGKLLRSAVIEIRYLSFVGATGLIGTTILCKMVLDEQQIGVNKDMKILELEGLLLQRLRT